jgi:hypothetical protein
VSEKELAGDIVPVTRPSGDWKDDDFDVLADGVVVGRIFKANASPVGSPWMWTLAFGHHEDRSPTHGYEPTREAAMRCQGTRSPASPIAVRAPPTATRPPHRRAA